VGRGVRGVAAVENREFNNFSSAFHNISINCL
jgi:hypothetical protein